MHTYFPDPRELLRRVRGTHGRTDTLIVTTTKPASARTHVKRSTGSNATGPRRASGKRSSHGQQNFDHLADLAPDQLQAMQRIAASLNRPRIDASLDAAFKRVAAGGAAPPPKPDAIGRQWDRAFARVAVAPKQSGATASGWDRAFAKADGRR